MLRALRADGPQTTEQLVAALAEQGRAVRLATVEAALGELAAAGLVAAARTGQAHRWRPLAPPGDPQAHTAAAATPTSADGVRAAVAALVTQERAGTRPRLTGTQVAALVGVKERRAQILLRELRANHGQPASGHGHRPVKGGT